ncbi:MAG: kinase/pyrophosphorylase [Alphaproteobacteria bacterium]|nr:kinase/pyrophosphorylase [Alphaproteobacteria bacterium]MCL2505284.1 kinase/pyrophosphorylase [Alphaproteobacteria bacterium]
MAFHIHLISDSTGETIENIAGACLAQFEGVEVKKHHWHLIKTMRLLNTVKENIKNTNCLVLYTLVNTDLRYDLEKFCKDNNIPCIAVLRSVLIGMMDLFQAEPTHNIGRQHILDDKYFARIDAIDFTMEHDDGRGIDTIEKADIVVLGVSRTSKTPTCFYLACKGYKAANIPFVTGVNLDYVRELKNPIIIGLTRDMGSLIAIRKNRLLSLNETRETSYTEPEMVREEMQEARRFFSKIGCHVIDVSRKSIEETSSEILMLLSAVKAARKLKEGKNVFPS